MTQVEDDEPALLLEKCDKEEGNMMLLNEKQVVPTLSTESDKEQVESNLWYLDNWASNMTGCRSKFSELNEGITGRVRSGDDFTIEIEGKGSITFKWKNGEERVLTKVYYILNLCSYIISLGQMYESGNKVVLKGEYLWVFD